tara:strand:- start:287 stop:628 length:342 start_codon:yes stop_codon:yes gene_type:complete
MTLQASGIIRILGDIELKNVGDTTVAKFYGGINEGKDKNGNWINNAIDVEVWGRSGEIIKEKMGQGDSFYGIGKIVMNEWESDGGKRRKHIFKCGRFEFLPRISDTSTSEVPF